MKSGIYTITNRIDGKIYVGMATLFSDRKRDHFAKLRGNSHHNDYLQAAYNKHGEENFVFEVLVECEEQFLFSEEHYWCNLLQTHNPNYGYNILPTNPHGKALTHSQETKRKLSEKGRGRPMSEKTRLALELHNKTYRHSPEALKKISENSKAHRHSDETKKKMSETRTGKIRGKYKMKNNATKQKRIDGERI